VTRKAKGSSSTPQRGSRDLADVRRIYERLRSRSLPEFPFLALPTPGCAGLLGLPDLAPLLRWGIFNPGGPTLDVLALVPHPDSAQVALLHSWINPFARSDVGWGLLPADAASDPEILSLVVIFLFARNGARGTRLLEGPPTFVLPSPAAKYRLEDGVARAALSGALQAVASPSLAASCDELEAHPLDPWERVLSGMKTIVAMATELGLDSALDSLEEDEPWSDAAFDRWWPLVTDPHHVSAELTACLGSWSGAIRQAGSMLDVVVDALAAIEFVDQVMRARRLVML